MLHLSTSAAVSTVLWLAAVSLMAAEPVVDTAVPDGILSRWALLVALAATCWTVSALINHARRVVLDIVCWEHRATRAALTPEASPPHGVVPIRRGGY